MELKISQSQKQKLRMTIQMKRMLHLLQIPSTDLLKEINEMLENCIFLEIKEPEYPNWYNSKNVLANNHETLDNENWLILAKNLKNHLHEQLNLLSISPQEQIMAEILIDSINEKGYLTITCNEVMQQVKLHGKFSVTENQVLKVLQKIQQFEPSGVGARNQQECLAIQINKYEAPLNVKQDALIIINKCFSKLIQLNYTLIMKMTNFSKKRLELAIEIIKNLHPFPGTIFDSSQTFYNYPDFFVFFDKNQWRVKLNRAVTPTLQINTEYVEAFNKKINNMHDIKKQFWYNQLKDGQNFLQSINNRYQTLYTVMCLLVKEQQSFLEKGKEAMQPLSMKKVAMQLNLHESTISRVVQNKYVQTPKGLIAMGDFFSSCTGKENRSSVEVQAKIHKLIMQENPYDPLSDSAIQHQLTFDGINVARRTITKYRKNLGFASYKKRKKQNNIH